MSQALLIGGEGLKKKWNRTTGFLWHKKTKTRKGHPACVFVKNRRQYKFFCFTHSPTTDGSANKKLKRNIDRADFQDCYVRPAMQIDMQKNFEKPYVKYRIHEDDLPMIRNLRNQKK